MTTSEPFWIRWRRSLSLFILRLLFRWAAPAPRYAAPSAPARQSPRP
ncbi:MAG: hypothetical protein ACM3S1_11925 [Hyphomicrobiales bacterium]